MEPAKAPRHGGIDHVGAFTTYRRTDRHRRQHFRYRCRDQRLPGPPGRDRSQIGSRGPPRGARAPARGSCLRTSARRPGGGRHPRLAIVILCYPALRNTGDVMSVATDIGLDPAAVEGTTREAVPREAITREAITREAITRE